MSLIYILRFVKYLWLNCGKFWCIIYSNYIVWRIIMIDKLRRFMYGRNGTDKLCFALIITSMVISLASRIAGNYWVQMPAYMLLIWTIFRMLSKNIQARRKENTAFLKIWNPIVKWFKLCYNRVRDIRSYRYYSCPNCKNALRVPKGKGKITITCPVCKTRFDKKT